MCSHLNHSFPVSLFVSLSDAVKTLLFWLCCSPIRYDKSTLIISVCYFHTHKCIFYVHCCGPWIWVFCWYMSGFANTAVNEGLFPCLEEQHTYSRLCTQPCNETLKYNLQMIYPSNQVKQNNVFLKGIKTSIQNIILLNFNVYELEPVMNLYYICSNAKWIKCLFYTVYHFCL